MDIEQKIREYLPGVIHMSLATVRDGKPWISEVHYVYDQHLNFYFRSLISRRHSGDIATNSYVAANIVEQHEKGQKVRAVYIEGTAEMLADVDENHPAFLLYSERFGSGPEILEEARTEHGHKFYKITPTTLYLFDGRESSPSQKYELPWRA
jgi:nitroimidazol reductase NimA-like FMN-containing flavoprotein (pyridoxamine 5'-phosphate oxidase superfamily)